MEIKDKKPITVYDAIKILEDREADGELEYEQDEALKYAKTFAKGTSKKVKELMKVVEDEEIAVILANIMPDNEDLVKTIVAKNKLELSNEQIKEILAIIKK